MASITIRVTRGGAPVDGAEIFTTVDNVKRTTDAQGEYSVTVPADYAQAMVIMVRSPGFESGGTYLVEAGDVIEIGG
ncbi:MAG: hypothetical protein IIC29_09000 [Chloroflexi bacterium]|nr:hypothetical protein [Chloroflexota bacterium]